MKDNTRKKLQAMRPSMRRVTLIVVLVLFVFSILLVSLVVSAVVLFTLNAFGLMQPFTEARLPMVIGFLFVVSLLVALFLTFIVGNRTLRPFRTIIEATNEIAAGNFNVRIEPKGPEEFQELATSFNEMAEELGSIETLRDDFVSSVSHEYKTPIVSIKGFAKLLKSEGITKEQHDEYVDVIIAESDRLAQLSGNVLLLSKIESSSTPGDVTVFSLDEQLRRVVLVMDQQISEAEVDVELDLSPCEIESSEELLQQVWINLLSNALKYTPADGRISLSVRCTDEGACVIVQDTGAGMSAEVLEHVFEKFYQGDDSRSAAGNGLGLTLAHRIVALCKGTIRIESTLDQGTKVLVELPKTSRSV